MKYTLTVPEAIAAIAIVFLIAVILPTGGWGQEARIDATTPLDQLRAHASGGNSDAMMELGERLVQGNGVTRDGPEGVKWLQKAAEAGKRGA
jgi:hypothetical protein